jgi:hypothetical protein
LDLYSVCALVVTTLHMCSDAAYAVQRYAIAVRAVCKLSEKVECSTLTLNTCTRKVRKKSRKVRARAEQGKKTVRILHVYTLKR